MTKWQRLKVKLHMFFCADLPLFFEGRSRFTKMSFGCLGVILAPILLVVLLIAHIFVFSWVMSLFNSNKTYPLLHPAEEIASVSIVQFSEGALDRRHTTKEVPAILIQSTVATTPVDADRISECTEALLDLPASRWWNDPSPSMDRVALLISYKDGSMEWISWMGTYQYTPGGEDSRWTWYYFDREEFYGFLQQFGYDPNS